MKFLLDPSHHSVHGIRTSLGILGIVFVLLGLMMGTQGWSCCEDLKSHNPMISEIIWHLRFPRSLGAWLSGALLGLAGILAQGLFRNPLADPFLLGSASGASLGVTVALLLGLLAQMGGGLNEWPYDWVHQVLGALGGWMAWLVKPMGFFFNDERHAFLLGFGVTALAFVGALLAVFLTLSLSRGVLQTQRLLLSGVVVGVVLGSLNNLILQRFPTLLGALQNFMLGSVANVDELGCLLMAVVLVFCLTVTWFYSPVLDAMGLGEQTARSLGFLIGRERWVLIAVLSLATATSVAQTGLIAFVGLAAPHMVRQIIKANYKAWIELSVLMGGALLVASDLIARTISRTQELPIGIVTALLGGGYLLRLLSKSNRANT